ncbi:aspartate/glutamate racemase family protein [Streptomyces niveus]|uniref:aspartate/glutamate racemase family protein n=1 Tax=Streptomyces niveus TaxID=193462 RepID=UPI0036EC65C0
MWSGRCHDLELITVDLTEISDYSWFIGCGLGFLAFVALERRSPADRGDTMTHIRVINPNTSRGMTETIGRCARTAAAPSTVVTAVSPAMGPESIESHYDEALAVPGLLAETATDEADGYGAADEQAGRVRGASTEEVRRPAR